MGVTVIDWGAGTATSALEGTATSALEGTATSALIGEVPSAINTKADVIMTRTRRVRIALFAMSMSLPKSLSRERIIIR